MIENLIGGLILLAAGFVCGRVWNHEERLQKIEAETVFCPHHRTAADKGNAHP